MTRPLTLLLLLLVIAVSAPAYGQFHFAATLTGEQEVPGVDTEATATITARFDKGFTKAHVVLKVKNGVGITAAHFHCHRPGANGPIAFGLFAPGPLFFDGTTAEGDLTNADFNMADCVPQVGRPVNNIAALALAMRDGLIYANVHTTAHPGGEVRGQLLEVNRGPGKANRGKNDRDDEEEEEEED
ncbi:MAG TPA: CHRD domain-containing protein [Terriglobia bacterium]|nr:CHRD domain-containing protein [Terriglobia bacterium]